MPTRLAVDSVEVVTIDINVPNTIGQHGPEYPTLRVMLMLTLVPYRRHDGPPLPVTLLHLRALLHTGNRRITEYQAAPNLYAEHLEHRATHHVALEFPLDAFRIRCIEDQRLGDFKAMIHLESVFAVHGATGIARFAKSDCHDLLMELPQSHWTGKVLPGLGYHAVGIVELPFPGAMVEEFRMGSTELRRAVTHFTEGKPPEAVGACRSAIQAVINSRPTEKDEGAKNGFTAQVDRFALQHLGGLSKSKRDHFRVMVTSLWNLASIPHHPGTEDYFTREDAELIIRETAAVLAYAGEVLP